MEGTNEEKKSVKNCFRRNSKLPKNFGKRGQNDHYTEWETPIPKILLSKANFAKKNYNNARNFTPFISKSVQIWDHFFLLLLPKDSESFKIFGHLTLGIGGQTTFKWYLKSEQTHRHTDTHTHMDILTNRKHRPRGPMLWKT